MSCAGTCFKDHLISVEDTIHVFAQLSPSTGYTWRITSKFGKVYEGSVTTDADGFFDIPVNALPDGFFTEFSGDFKLEVLDTDSCKPVNFKVAQEYDCINFHVKGGTAVKDALGCEF